MEGIITCELFHPLAQRIMRYLNIILYNNTAFTWSLLMEWSPISLRLAPNGEYLMRYVYNTIRGDYEVVIVHISANYKQTIM